MALLDRAPRKALVGRPKPRIAPPVPARSGLRQFEAQADELGLTLFPWQRTAARYITALGPGDTWLYGEVALIVARQNGKTTELVPLITQRLRLGQRIMHTAQNRELPREVFGLVAEHMQSKYGSELKSKPRFANGQEEIRTRNGGVYRIVAPTRGGARGPSNDLVIVDELREMVDFDFIAAAKPTLTASKNPQMIYLSNAGTEDSRVLNALKDRAGTDPELAYLEWSASPERSASDRVGWSEANPSMGHMPWMETYLEKKHRTAVLEHTLPIFDTEHLCRWVLTLQPRLVEVDRWEACREKVEEPRRPMMAVSMDPSGTRASAAVAWPQMDGLTYACRVVADVTGSPIDTDRLGRDLSQMALRLGVPSVGYSRMTDGDLARHFRKPVPIDGHALATASENFVRRVERREIRWDTADEVTSDLGFTVRKFHDGGTYQAVKAQDDRPITASLAAIRAVWMASGPRPAAPRVL